MPHPVRSVTNIAKPGKKGKNTVSGTVREPERNRGSTVRIFWILTAVAVLLVLFITAWAWIRTSAQEGIGWWHEHHLRPSDPVTEAPLPSPVTPASGGDGFPSRVTPGAMAAPTSADESGEEIVYRHRPNDRMEIALSFDDGPHPYYTPLILDILAEYGVRATFFMVGENVTYYTAAAEAVVAAGHEIGNHTQSHRAFTRMSEGEMLSEITACEEAIASVSECRPHFIRPPEGEMSAAMRRVVGGLDYRIILWDVDTRDWAHTPPQTICDHILDTVRPGDIILMHDFIGHDSPTPEALRLVIPALLERGYRFVTVGELVDGATHARPE